MAARAIQILGSGWDHVSHSRHHRKQEQAADGPIMVTHLDLCLGLGWEPNGEMMSELVHRMGKGRDKEMLKEGKEGVGKLEHRIQDVTKPPNHLLILKDSFHKDGRGDHLPTTDRIRFRIGKIPLGSTKPHILLLISIFT